METGTLGLGDPMPASALTGFEVAEVLDSLAELIRELQPVQPDPTPAEAVSLAIIGAPNTGKSSLVNRLCGDQRMVVSDIPGTTRDAVDTIIQYYGKSVRLIDTAGLRRKRFGLQGIEFYTTIRSIKALDRCQVAVLMVDATQGLTQGDIRLLSEASEKGVACCWQ
jgi:GTP-binding protein